MIKKVDAYMKVEYEWRADDGRGREEMIAQTDQRKPWPLWCRVLLILLGGLAGAALAYSGYVAFS
jgi:hypothetical protein